MRESTKALLHQSVSSAGVWDGSKSSISIEWMLTTPRFTRPTRSGCIHGLAKVEYLHRLPIGRSRSLFPPLGEDRFTPVCQAQSKHACNLQFKVSLAAVYCSMMLRTRGRVDGGRVPGHSTGMVQCRVECISRLDNLFSDER